MRAAVAEGGFGVGPRGGGQILVCLSLGLEGLGILRVSMEAAHEGGRGLTVLDMLRVVIVEGGDSVGAQALRTLADEIELLVEVPFWFDGCQREVLHYIPKISAARFQAIMPFKFNPLCLINASDTAPTFDASVELLSLQPITVKLYRRSTN